jgi:hypothetical protein
MFVVFTVLVLQHTGSQDWVESSPHLRTPFFWLHFLILSSSLQRSLSGGLLSTVCIFVSQDQAPLFSFPEHFLRFCDVSILFSWTPCVLLFHNKSNFCSSFYVIITSFFPGYFSVFLYYNNTFIFLDTCLFVPKISFSWTLSAPLCQQFSWFLPLCVNSFLWLNTFCLLLA